MATPTVLKTPIVSGADLAHELDDDLARATALSDLAYWISQARNLIDNLRYYAEHDTALGERLSTHRLLRIGSPSWDDEVNEGFQHLQIEITGKLATMRDSVDRATGSGKVAR